MLTLYQIIKETPQPLTLPDMTSLDAVARQLPDGFYSTFRTFDSCTRVVGLSAHLKRLPHIDASSLRRNLIQLLEPFRPPFGPGARRGETADEARVRVMETRSGDIYIAIEPLKLLPHEVYEKGVRVETTTLERRDPRIKSTAFISQSDDKRKYIAKEGIFEALLVKNGKILEGMTSNFFYIVSSTLENVDYALYTAHKDILLGVTRTMVIRAARGRGVEVRYSPLKLNQVLGVNEAFITSSSRGIVPVIQIDDVIVGQGSPGKITKMLMSAYEEYVMRHAEVIR